MKMLGRVMYREAGVQDFSGYTVRINPAGFYKPEAVRVFTAAQLQEIAEEFYHRGTTDWIEGKTCIDDYLKELELEK